MLKYQLCRDEFWNNNLTWYTNSPQFTSCFRETILIWFPSLLLIIATISESISIHEAKKKKQPPIRWNTFNVIRIFLTTLLIINKIIHSYKNIEYNIQDTKGALIEQNNISNNQDDTYYVAFILGPIIQAICYLILVIIYVNHKKIGIHTSASTWFYLFTFVICDTIEVYTLETNDLILENNDNFLRILKEIHYGLLVLLFIFECHGDTANIHETQIDLYDPRPYCPELQSSFFSSITFWWYNSFLIFGYKCKIRLGDLWKTMDRDKSSNVVPRFKSQWIKGKEKVKKNQETYYTSDGKRLRFNSVWLCLIKLNLSKLFLAASFKFMHDCLQYTQPIILKYLIRFMSDEYSDQTNWHGLLYSISFLVLPTFQSLLLGNYFYCMQVVGIQIRTMIVGSVYRKSLVLSGSSRSKTTTGEIVNLMAVDAGRFENLFMFGGLNLLWSSPFQICLAIYLLYLELGWSVFAGVICMALVLPANAILSNRYKMKQIKLMKTKDERVKQMNEVLSGIKVIKLYAWENSFINNLFNLRSKEMDYLKRCLKLDAAMTFLWQCSPFVVAFVSFLVYVISDSNNVLTAEKAFVSISLFNLLRFPLTVLPSLVTSLILTIVSGQRLNRFFNSDELFKYVTREEHPSGEVVTIEKGTLSWSSTDDDNDVNHQQTELQKVPPTLSMSQKSKPKAILKDIDLHVKRNSFVAIVGPVASGKSSLISSIIGEMHRINGNFNIDKNVTTAYVPQQAWIQNMTVRDNILFGKPFNEDLYKQILSVCSLEADLETLAGGDMAEIGEKGINLSGGQKQRVSLARACYSNSDLYLLDDPLSALDSHVAKHVYERVLSSSSGLLRNKTRILATNFLSILPETDYIIVLNKGKIAESGSYKDLIAKNGHLAESMKQYLVKQSSDGNEYKHSDSESSLNLTKHIEPLDILMNSFEESPKSSLEIISENEEKIMKSIGPPKATQEIGRLIDDERMETGSVNYKVYMAYFKALSVFWTAGVVFFSIANSSFNVSTNLWLSSWTTDKTNNSDTRTSRLVTYAVLGGLQCFSTLLASLSLCFGSTRASRLMHSDLLEKVMHSPMSFFDTTPIGRIINKFSKDIDVLDSTIPTTFRNWLTCLLQVLSTVCIICYSFPLFIGVVVPLGIVYYLIQKIFIVTTRQLKRLESTTRSPIYSHFSETLSGITTIRAYDCSDRFVRLSDKFVDTNQSCSYPNIIANRWLSVRLELFGNIITTCAALFSVYYKGIIGPNIVGLNISYSMSITQTLGWFVRQTSDLETNIVSVERILEYMANKQEDLWIKEKRPPKNWPDKGVIRIEDYSARYREDTDLVLKKLTLTTTPREKLGIVGRTGSGKSSLSLALFRILEPAMGRIVIDNLNIADYGLHDLRSKLSIIPQDPMLFSGTLRFNLDPLNVYSDEQLWRAIELSHLNEHIKALDSGLDFGVSEFGSNFSVGQRQLICLARAILRKSKILILDEATASVDLETDSIVQKTIRDIFIDCTVITVAHRLHTILDSDRILILDGGHIKELDKPVNLISNPNSAFSGLVRDSGIDVSSLLNSYREKIVLPELIDKNSEEKEEVNRTKL